MNKTENVNENNDEPMDLMQKCIQIDASSGITHWDIFRTV